MWNSSTLRPGVIHIHYVMIRLPATWKKINLARKSGPLFQKKKKRKSGPHSLQANVCNLFSFLYFLFLGSALQL